MKTLQEIADFFQKPAAQDEDGEVYIHETAPIIDEMNNLWTNSADGYALISEFIEIETVPDWKQSLRLPKPDATKLKVDDKVMVRDSKDEPWVKRYFSRIGAAGLIMCFIGGNTSWSRSDCVAKEEPWKEWRLPTEEELKR